MPSTNARVPLRTPEATQKQEQALYSYGLSPEALMETAAERIWCALKSEQSKTLSSRRWLVLAGPGHNGADGWAVARKAAEAGIAVDVFPLSADMRPLTQKQRQFALAQGAQELTATPHRDSLTSYDLVLDALFGIGLSKPLPPEAQALASALHASGVMIISIDVPSGLCARTGCILGNNPEGSMRAHTTFTLGAFKPGLLCERALPYTGALQFLPLGFPCPSDSDAAVLNFPLDFSFLKKKNNEHKLSRGEVLVVAGSNAFPGAGFLTIEALCALSPGYIRLSTQSRALQEQVLRERPEVVFSPLEDSFLKRVQVAVVGCGVSRPKKEQAEHMAQCLPSCATVLLDGAWCEADVLACFSKRGHTLVATPHAGEFERLCPHIAQRLAAGRLSKAEAASEAAKHLQCFLLLKGPYSAAAAPSGVVLQSTQVNPSLARAGTGDTLAGVLGGVLLHGLHAKEPLLELLAFAIELHSRCAHPTPAKRFGALTHIANIERRVAQQIVAGHSPS